ncbi:unnamed protein product [Choristocarpus tenellus]
MVWSRVGFGAARCALGVAEHEAALVRALQGGVTVVDTNANYMGGKSEELVGKVVRKVFGDEGNEKAKILTKFGYASSSSGRHPGMVTAATGLSHSMHPDFMCKELERSLQRLQTKTVEGFLVENPEHHLTHRLQSAGAMASGNDGEGIGVVAPFTRIQLNEVREAFYGDMTSLFEAMEERVDEGQVRAYGVSSTGLSLPDKEPLHISWEALVQCAREAAKRRGKVTHSFKIVQMPANLLETTGLKEAPSMEAAGIRVMACHPLTASMPNGTFQLVDDALRGDLPHDYMDVCRQVLEHFTMDLPEGRELTEEESDIIQGCRFLQQLVKDMNSQLVSFTSFEHYEVELAGSITPMINNKFEGLDATSADILQAFFERYGAMVRYSCAQRTRDMVVSGEGCPSGAHVIPDDETLQHYALRWLVHQPGVGCTVVDMENPQDVDNTMLTIQAS